MAKKKTPPAPAPSKPTRGRPKSPGGPKPRTPIVVTLRGTPEWETWLDGLCDVIRKNAGVRVKIERTHAIDLALESLAAGLGHSGPPDRF